jgi:hypothetical protein
VRRGDKSRKWTRSHAWGQDCWRRRRSPRQRWPCQADSCNTLVSSKLLARLAGVEHGEATLAAGRLGALRAGRRDRPGPWSRSRVNQPGPRHRSGAGGPLGCQAGGLAWPDAYSTSIEHCAAGAVRTRVVTRLPCPVAGRLTNRTDSATVTGTSVGVFGGRVGATTAGLAVCVVAEGLRMLAAKALPAPIPTRPARTACGDRAAAEHEARQGAAHQPGHGQRRSPQRLRRSAATAVPDQEADDQELGPNRQGAKPAASTRRKGRRGCGRTGVRSARSASRGRAVT